MTKRENMMSYMTRPHFRGYRHFLRCVVPQSAPVCEFFIYLSGFNEDYSRLFRCSTREPGCMKSAFRKLGIRCSEVRPLYGINFRRDIARVRADGQFYTVLELDRMKGTDEVEQSLGFLARCGGERQDADDALPATGTARTGADRRAGLAVRMERQTERGRNDEA